MIVKAPNEILSKRCETLRRHNYVGIANTFIKKSWKHRDGACGIAANQINMPYRLFIGKINKGGKHQFWKIFINPRIVIKPSSAKIGGWFPINEECLSIPGKSYNTIREDHITIVYRDMDFKIVWATYDNMNARIIQHEVDHLNGTLISDIHQTEFGLEKHKSINKEVS